MSHYPIIDYSGPSTILYGRKDKIRTFNTVGESQMKLIIAGRNLSPSLDFIMSSINMSGVANITEIVSGAAKGVDSAGENWANEYSVAIKRFHADWDAHGRAAGPIRNKEMARYADRLLLVWNGESRGSLSMKKEMNRLNKPVYEVILRRS